MGLPLNHKIINYNITMGRKPSKVAAILLIKSSSAQKKVNQNQINNKSITTKKEQDMALEKF